MAAWFVYYHNRKGLLLADTFPLSSWFTKQPQFTSIGNQPLHPLPKMVLASLHKRLNLLFLSSLPNDSEVETESTRTDYFPSCHCVHLKDFHEILSLSFSSLHNISRLSTLCQEKLMILKGEAGKARFLLLPALPWETEVCLQCKV